MFQNVKSQTCIWIHITYNRIPSHGSKTCPNYWPLLAGPPAARPRPAARRSTPGAAAAPPQPSGGPAVPRCEPTPGAPKQTTNQSRTKKKTCWTPKKKFGLLFTWFFQSKSGWLSASGLCPRIASKVKVWLAVETPLFIFFRKRHGCWPTVFGQTCARSGGAARDFSWCSRTDCKQYISSVFFRS